jgi:hypothetical protein
MEPKLGMFPSFTPSKTTYSWQTSYRHAWLETQPVLCQTASDVRTACNTSPCMVLPPRPRLRYTFHRRLRTTRTTCTLLSDLSRSRSRFRNQSMCMCMRKELQHDRIRLSIETSSLHFSASHLVHPHPPLHLYPILLVHSRWTCTTGHTLSHLRPRQ